MVENQCPRFSVDEAIMFLDTFSRLQDAKNAGKTELWYLIANMKKILAQHLHVDPTMLDNIDLMLKDGRSPTQYNLIEAAVDFTNAIGVHNSY